MTIGAALLLLAAGAILRFAISTVSTHGINVHVIGDILMAVGVLGLILWAVVWAPWARRRRAGYSPAADDVPPGDPYTRRDPYYEGERRYPADRRYEDQYPPRP
jgi:hypothetical protein